MMYNKDTGEIIQSQTLDVKLKRWLLLTPTIAEAAAIKLAKS